MANAIKDAFKVFTGQTLSFVIRFVTSILIARWLGSDGKGLYTSLLMVPNMMVTLGELGMRQSIIYYLGRKIYILNEIASTAIITVMCIVLPMIAVCFVIFNTYYKDFFSAMVQVTAVFIIPTTMLVKVLSGVFLGLNRVGVYSKVAWIPATIELIFACILVLVFGMGLEGAIISLVLGSVFTIFYGLYNVKNDIEFRFSYYSVKVAKSILSKGLLFALSLFIIQLNYRIDIFLLKGMVSMEDVGIYSVGVSLAEVLWQIPAAITVVILARTATSNNESQKYKVSQSLRVSFFAMMSVSIIAIFMLNYLIPIIYGVDFIRSVSVNRILMIGVVIFTFYKILNSRIAGLGKPQITLILFIPCLFVKVGLNLWLVPHYGIEGAAWASNISYILASILILVAFSKIENISIIEILKPRKDDFLPLLKMIRK